jgi:hypothetical protein
MSRRDQARTANGNGIAIGRHLSATEAVGQLFSLTGPVCPLCRLSAQQYHSFVANSARALPRDD